MYDINQILQILPHRYPFLLVDKILEMDVENKCIKAQKNVTINEHFFQGHFPQEPVMPGVLQLEAMAQVGACLVLSLPEFQGKIAYLIGIDNAKFRAKVVPGDVMIIEGVGTKSMKRMGTMKGVCKVNDKVVSEAEISFIIN